MHYMYVDSRGDTDSKGFSRWLSVYLDCKGMHVFNWTFTSLLFVLDIFVLSCNFYPLGGATIGLLNGLYASLVTRFTRHVRVVEPLVIFSSAYFAFLMAELFHWSGDKLTIYQSCMLYNTLHIIQETFRLELKLWIQCDMSVCVSCVIQSCLCNQWGAKSD